MRFQVVLHIKNGYENSFGLLRFHLLSIWQSGKSVIGGGVL